MDLNYVNSRVRGLRSRLLNRADYELFISMEGSMEAFLTALRNTRYGPYLAIAEASEGDIEPSEIINYAVSRNLTAAYRTIWNLAPEGEKGALQALFSIWEVYNLKAVLRGIDRGISQEKIFAFLIPAGSMDVSALKELSGVKDALALAGLLAIWGSPYASPVREFSPEYVRNKKLAPIELALDRTSLALFRDVKGFRPVNRTVLSDILAFRADYLNMMTLFKVHGERYGAGELKALFIKGGRSLSLKLYIELSGVEGLEHLIGNIIDRIPDQTLRGLLLDIDTSEIGLIEARFESVMVKKLLKLSITEPESIALTAWYIFVKAREVKNIRLLGSAVSFGIPSDEVRRMVSYPEAAAGGY